MFRKPKPHMIESDAGFSVERVAFRQLVYREDDKKVTLSIEYYGDIHARSFILYLAEDDYWDPPFDTVKISDEDWKRIGDNIREAYGSEGQKVHVYFPTPEERAMKPPGRRTQE